MPEGYFDAGMLADGNGRIAKCAMDGNRDVVKLWVPNTVVGIDTWAFRNCETLSEVVFEAGESSLSIGMMVFEGCENLKSVSLPGRVIGIGRACFRGCMKLQSFSIAQGDVPFAMPLNVFDSCENRNDLYRVLEDECNRRANCPVDINVYSNEVVGQYLLYPAMHEDSGQQLPDGIPPGTLFVCVDRTWSVEMCDEHTGQRISLEDCARGYWCETHLRKVRLPECRWLMAVAHKKIAGVWKIDLQRGWLPPGQIPKPTWPSDNGPWKVPRLGCTFLPDDDEARAVRNGCMGKDLALYFRQSQTVRGVFLK